MAGICQLSETPLTGHHPSSKGIRPAASRGGSTHPCRDHSWQGPGVETWPRRKNAKSTLCCTRGRSRESLEGRSLEEGLGSEDRQTGQQRHIGTEGKRQRQIETHRDTDRGQQTETDRPRDRQTDIEAQRHTEIHTQRQTDRQRRQRESLPAPGSHPCPTSPGSSYLGVLGVSLHPLHAVKIYLLFFSANSSWFFS